MNPRPTETRDRPWRDPLAVANGLRDRDGALALLSDGGALGRWSFVAADPDRVHVGPLEPGGLALLRDPDFAAGVVGLLASRLRERHHRPTIVFADGGDGILKGSGRSIPGLHLRDALDLVDRRAPGLILKFGGHAAAAGLSLPRQGLDAFAELFEAVARESLSAADLTLCIETDGELAAGEFTLRDAEALRDTVWGQGFPPPLFHGEFILESQRLVGEKHLKLRLAGGGIRADAMLFFHDAPLPPRIQAAYRLEVNEWQGAKSLQLNVSHWSGLA